MKFLKLGYTGYGESDGVIDFTNTAGTLTVLAGVTVRSLSDLLCAAIYGDIEVKLKPNTKIYLDFEQAELIYRLEREFDEDENTKMLALVLQDGDSNDRFEGDEAQDIIFKFLPLDSKAFREYVIINRKILTDSFIQGDADQRIKFVDDSIFTMSGTTDASTRMSQYQDEEKNIKDQINAIEPTTEADIESGLDDIAAIESEISELKKSHAELAVTATLEEDSQGAQEYSNALERANAMREVEAQLEKESEVLKEHEDIIEISEKYLTFKKTSNELKQLSEDLESIKQKRDEAKINADEAKKAADQFAYDLERQDQLIKETGSRFQSSLLLYAENPSNSQVPSTIEQCFAEINLQKNQLIEQKKTIETLKSELAESIETLLNKRKELLNTADYKKAVYDSNILTNSLNLINDEIQILTSSIEELNKEKSELETSSQSLYDDIHTIGKEQTELRKKANIEEGSLSIIDSYTLEFKKVNQLTAKYFEVKAYDDECKNISEKITNALASVDKYKEKLQLALENKEKLLKTSEATEATLKLLQTKRNEYDGFNKMRAISDSLLYGSHCPVCDGYITYKNELPQKDTRALDAQIEKIKADVDKNLQTMLELTAVIGQREVAVRVGNQYVDSLRASLDEVNSKIAKILNEYDGVKDIAGLKGIFVDALARLDSFVELTREYSSNEILLQALQSNHALQIERLAQLNEKILPSLNERIEKLKTDENEVKIALNLLNNTIDGKDPKEILQKVQLSEREIETVDEEIELQRNKLAKAIDEYNEIVDVISTLDSKDITAEIDGQTLTYVQAAIQATARELLDIQVDELSNPFDYEAQEKELKKLIKKSAHANNKYNDLVLATENAENDLNSKASANEELFASCVEKFSKYSIENEDDALRLINETPEVIAYKEKKAKYDEEMLAISDALAEGEKKMLARSEAEAIAKDAADKLKNVEADIAQYEEALDSAKTEVEARRARVAKLAILDNKLGKVKKLISNLDEVSKTISTNEVSASDLAVTIFDFANVFTTRWSQERYELKISESSIDLFNVEKGELVDPIKYTNEEKSILEFSIIIAYGDAMESLLGLKVQRVLPLYNDEIQNETVKVLLNAVNNKDVLVSIEDLDSAHILRNVLYDIQNN
ncbi:MAG: hypothetical protein LBF68_04680 [Christensenellaceae bacterium]|jgi:DNA repair exonuclease SbcCD ATPase subunit|nr:hypothetical protein [Christensenellaceae bacterium]